MGEIGGGDVVVGVRVGGGACGRDQLGFQGVGMLLLLLLLLLVVVIVVLVQGVRV